MPTTAGTAEEAHVTTDRDTQRLLEMADRVELTELLHRFHQAVDFRDWEAFADIFTEDATIEFESLNNFEIFGMEGRHEGRQAIVDWVKTGVAPFDWNGAPVHFMTNHVFWIDGDTARSKTYLIETDLVSGYVICSGVYDSRHVRVDGAWRIQGFHLGMYITEGVRESLVGQRGE
jgi:hypothetical protein